VRVVGADWAGVTWSELDEGSADAAIAAQLARFDGFPGEWEWKHYSYDRPADLPRRLLSAGLRAEPTESLLCAELAELDLDAPSPEGVEVVPVEDERAVRELLAVQAEVFGDAPAEMERVLLAGLAQRPPSVAAVVARAGGVGVGAGRVELPEGSDFAGLWGGCTHPDWRRRGIFRALVAHRAAVAASRGHRWLHVDAAEESRPILLQLGFIELAKTTPYVPASAA
jgi:GNAT superfamily N-acetyltransferase